MNPKMPLLALAVALGGPVVASEVAAGPEGETIQTGGLATRSPAAPAGPGGRRARQALALALPRARWRDDRPTPRDGWPPRSRDGYPLRRGTRGG